MSLNEARAELTGAEERTGEVNIEHRLPLLEAHLLNHTC